MRIFHLKIVSFYIKQLIIDFRNKTTPFKIKYNNEGEIDSGGIMGDFFNKLICDIKTPRVGFFIQKTKGRNLEGNVQDIGALIADEEFDNLIFPSRFLRMK